MNYGNGQNQGQQGYGQPQQQWAPPPKKGLGAGAITLIVLGCLFSGCVGLCAIGAAGAKNNAANGSSTDSPTRAAAVAAAAKTPAAPKVYTPVSASAIISDYEGNEIRGDNAWKDKDVAITGVVKSIDKGAFGGLHVQLGTGERMNFHTILVGLQDSQASAAANLTKGQTATFKGHVQGYILGSVSLQDAVID